MGECKLKNFNEEQFSGSLRLGKFINEENVSLQTIKNHLELVLNKVAFSTNSEMSDNPDEYSESIDNLIQFVTRKLKSYNKLRLNNTQLDELGNWIKSILNPSPLTKVEKDIQTVVKGTVIRDEYRQSDKFNKFIRNLFKNLEIVNQTRQDLFDYEIALRTIINPSKGEVVDNDYHLNTNIINYLNEQYKIIYKFLINKGFNKDLIPQNLYISRNNIYQLVSTYNAPLLMMYNYIKNNVSETELEESWINYLEKEKVKDHSLFDAVSAYINIVYFDDIIKYNFDQYITINQDSPSIFNKSEKSGRITIEYKYSRARGNSNAISHWGDNDNDSLKTLSNFSEIIIGLIKVWDYKTKTIEHGKMFPKDFIGVFTKLLDIGNNLSNKKLRNLINSFNTGNRVNNLNEILNEIFQEDNITILKELDQNGIDSISINYLYSVYRTVFKGWVGHKSWFEIEQNYIKQNGLTSRYSLISTIVKLISSNSAMNYFQKQYNFTSKDYEATIKSKFSTDNRKFDIERNINDSVINREDKKDILNTYEIKLNPENVTINISGNEYKINTSNILDKFSKINFVKGKYPIFEKLNFNVLKRLDNLVKREDLSEQEQEFINLLEFIDTILGTNFSKDVEGFRKINQMIEHYPNSLKDMFISASRGLTIIKIYDVFRSLKDEQGNQKYYITEFQKFWNDDENPYKNNLNLDKVVNKDNYLRKRINGEHLTVVYVNEKWIDALTVIEARLEGDTSKSVISNLEGDKIPNSSTSFLGSEINQQLNKSNELQGSSKNLLFSSSTLSKAIKTKAINTDIKTRNGITKSIKNMTYSELQYDAIVNNFIIPYLQSNGSSVFIQPTVYSDKTKFIIYEIALNDILGSGFKLHEANKLDNFIEQKIIDSIGISYKNVWNKIKNDYKLIFPEFKNQDGTLNVSLLQNWLKTHSVKDLQKKINEYNKIFGTNLVFYNELHFRQLKKGMSINELLYEFAENLYTPDNLHKRLYKEKINFVQELLNTRTKFLLDFNSSNELDSVLGNPITKMLSKFNNYDKWINGKRMVLGKIINTKTGISRDVLYGKIDLQENEVFEINPILNSFFLIDNLIGNNLRLSLTGSEINHTVKSLYKLDLGSIKINNSNDTLNNHKDLIRLLNPNYEGNLITFYDLNQAIKNSNNVKLNKDQKRILQYIKEIYNNKIYEIENAAQGAQFKRNVTIPGTITHYSNSELNQIGKTMNIAVINDIKANVFNFDGKTDKIDAHDGAAWVNPFWSILENLSLQDSEVGTVKKPIHHWYDDNHMSATLLKYAVNTITNRDMIRSEGNPSNKIRLHNIFKKMTNQKWNPNEVDLLNGCGFKYENEEGKIDFNKMILENKRLFYIDGNNYYEIVDFGIENGVYYTVEQEVSYTGSIFGQQYKVYHYFDNNSNHHKSKSILTDSHGLHTIQSLFELHTALGGIYSGSLNSENSIQYSEASNYAVTQFIINVATLKPGLTQETASLNQSDYYQPLKYSMIAMIANQTAVKNGAGNVNPTSSFYDDSELTYITVGTDNYGIQMDADHESDESTMTEFSQVISSLDAQGKMHKYVRQIYESLGQVALQSAQIELEAVEEFRKTGNKSKLYEVVGRTIIANLKRNKGDAGLAQAILDNVEDEMNLVTDHSKGNVFIPFSDKTIYSTILSTFVSVINKKSIKRKYPGQGTVMCPGYDMATVYNINGNTYLFEDLIKKAYLENYTSEYTDISLKNRSVVNQYLQSLQQQQYLLNISDFDPTDNVLITVQGERFMIENLDTDLVEYEIVKELWKDQEKYPGKTKTVLKIYLKNQKHKGSFDLIKDEEFGYYSVHFKTGDADTNEIFGSTKQERQILYENLYNAIPYNAKVSTWGNVSEGGLFALDKLMSEYIGDDKLDNIVEQRKVYDRQGNEILIPVYVKSSMSDTQYDSVFKEHLSLDEINDYYNFTSDINVYLYNKGYINIQELKLQKDITRPRNLAPTKLRFKYIKNGEEISVNIYNHFRIKNLFLEINEIDNDKNLTDKEKDFKIQQARKKWNPQQAFDDLNKENPTYSETFIIDENGIAQNADFYDVNRETIINIPAELIMSNIYKSKFSIREGDTLQNILEKGVNYFKESIELIPSNNYDVVFTKSDNRNLYITFKPIAYNSDSMDSNKRNWNIVPKDFVYPENYQGDQDIKFSIWAVTKDNIPMFEVGRKKINRDVKYDKTLKKFITETKDENGKLKTTILPNQQLYSRYGDDQVLEYVEFVSNYVVNEHNDINSYKYQLYNINKENLKKVSFQKEYSEKELTRTKDGKTYKITQEQKFDEDLQYFISKLLSDIYKTQDFNGIQINSKMSKTSFVITLNSLYNLSKKLNYDEKLSKYLLQLYDFMKQVDLEKPNKTIQLKKLQLALLTKKYHDSVAQIKYNSFVRSLRYTASRIPAQTLQSFMQMKLVGFTGTTYNQCFVSHWQTWLQGSDYDIDKAYIMGLSFDGNGKYIGWSNLFNYDSIELIKASEELPIPKNKKYIKSTEGLNIDEYVIKINQASTKELKLKRTAQLINYLNENEELTIYKDENDNIQHRITYSDEFGDQVLKDLITHESTKIPPHLIEDATKNFISSHIQTVIQSPVNMIQAYSPIEMEMFRKAADNSPKGNQSTKYTMLNPMTKMQFQYQNMTGKAVIGIAANGEKASFMWHHYLNHVVHNINPEDIENNIDANRAKFSFNSYRIKGRSSGEPQVIEINTLPDVYFGDVDPRIRQYFGYRLTGIITVDLMISQVLSSATDNAKELILAKVNAGNKLASMYLFLITLGFDINDIVKFMTSPVVQFIDDITNENIFDVNFDLKTAINLCKGDFSSFCNTYMKSVYNKSSDKIKNLLKSGKTDEIRKLSLEEGFNISKELEELLTSIDEIKSLRKFDVNSEDTIKDIQEFQNIKKGADEFTSFAKILGMNQGLKTDKVSLQTFVESIKSLVRSKEDDFDLNIKEFFTNPEYQELVVERYEGLKQCINIFDVVRKLPHFKSIGELLALVIDVDQLSIKSRIYDQLLIHLKNDNIFRIPDTFRSNILNSIGKQLIYNYIKSIKDIKIPYTQGTKIINATRDEIETKEQGTISFNSLEDIATFKYVFEKVIIPKLKLGKIMDFENGKVIEKNVSGLLDNQFIQGLIRGSDKGEIPLYKVDLNMLTIENTNYSFSKFQKYTRALQLLKNIRINGTSLQDIFILYNLIVNQNQYGSERLTTLFRNLISTDSSLSLINDYLNYIGKLDYFESVENLDIDYKQITIDSAPIVNSEYGHKEPFIKLQTEESGIVVKKRDKGQYVDYDIQLLPKKSNENPDKLIQRTYINQNYFVLGGLYKLEIEELLRSIQNVNSSIMDSINQLINKGILVIQQNCK